MWTAEHRHAAERRGLRYVRNCVASEVLSARDLRLGRPGEVRCVDVGRAGDFIGGHRAPTCRPGSKCAKLGDWRCG